MSWYYPHTSGDSALSFIQSQFLKSIWRWHPVCWLAWVFSWREPTPPSSAKKRNISGIHHDILCGKVTNLTWQDGVSALREVLRTWSHWMESDRWVNNQRKGSPVFLPQLSLHGWSRTSSSGSHMNMQLCPTCVPLKYPTGLTQMYPLPQIRSFNQLASFVIIHPACQGSQQSWEHLTCLEKVLHRHGFSLTPLQDSPLCYFIHTDPHLLRLEGQSIHPGAKPPSRENLYIVPLPTMR